MFTNVGKFTLDADYYNKRHKVTANYRQANCNLHADEEDKHVC